MKIALANFQGEIPRLEPRALPINYASVSKNTNFDNGILSPLRSTSVSHTFGADVSSFYLFNATWLGWSGIVDVAPAPVASDRIYYTGDGAPKVRDGATVYALALPAPVAAPTVVNLTSPDPNFLEATYFSYTYVTSLGEESAPSPLSAVLDTSAGIVVRVNGFTAPPAGRAITTFRIYRSQTSATGATAFFFVADLPIASSLYDHDMTATPLGELISSTDFDTPPDTLTGLTAMPNGMMAAFTGKDVYFCEPYKPHAWPEKYVLTMDYTIVGLSAFGSNLAVLTTGTPYILQGTHPDSMASEKMESGLPCLSRRGIVDVGYAAIYPSTEGLAMISSTDVKVISKGVFTREQWRSFSPDTIVAERFRGQYLFLRNVSAFTVYNGNGPSGYTELERTDLVGSGPTLAGDPLSYVVISGGTPDSSFGEQRLGIIDLEGESPFFVQTDLARPKAMLNDVSSGNLFLLDTDARSVKLWEDPSAAPSVANWQSKLFSSFMPASIGAVFVRTARPLLTEDSFAVRIYADGVLVDTISQANSAERVAAFGLAQEWVFEVASNVPVVSVTAASTIDELMEAA
jgi:hypothetical protein